MGATAPRFGSGVEPIFSANEATATDSGLCRSEADVTHRRLAVEVAVANRKHRWGAQDAEVV
jgi:hypothetical protein